MQYPVEQFSEAERALLEPHFTNLDRPVFCITGLPEVVKGALFARYSRYPGTLRRLYLDEFVEQGQAAPVAQAAGSERAEQLYQRVFLEFGDDSVAQLGGAHLACEWASNVLTKILQRGRLAAYLEQSTRYIAYDSRLPSGRYRYYFDERLGEPYAAVDGTDLRSLLGRPRAHAGLDRRAVPARRASPSRSGGVRSRPRRSTRCAACCRPAHSATSASTPPARPTSSS